MSLLRVVFFPLFFLSSSCLFSASQDLIPKNSRSFQYEGVSYPQSKKWVEKIVSEARKHDITREDIQSPHAFEIFLVKALTSFGHPTPLLNKEALPEFMRFQMTELRHLESSMNLLVKMLTDLDRLDSFLQERGVSLSTVEYQKLMKEYSMSSRRNRVSFLTVVSSFDKIKNAEDIKAMEDFFEKSASEEEKKQKLRDLSLLLREILERGYSKSCSQLKGGQTLELCLHKVALKVRSLIDFLTKRYIEGVKPIFKTVKSFSLLLRLLRIQDLKKEDFTDFNAFELEKMSSLIKKLKEHSGIAYFPKKETTLFHFALELKKSFSEESYKMPPWLEVEEELRALFKEFEKFFDLHFQRLDKDLVTRRGLSREVVPMKSGL